MDSNSQGWNGSFRRTYPTRAVDNHRLMGPGDSLNDRKRREERENDVSEREGIREWAMERERVYFGEKTMRSRMKEKVDL